MPGARRARPPSFSEQGVSFERMRGKGWALVVLCMAVACGAQPTPQAWTPVARSAATRTDVEALLARVAAEHLCKQVDGRFVPISMMPPPRGPLGGLAASTGAWWVRSCRPTPLGNYLVAFELGGSGWVWADHDGMVFSLHQFVFFNAAVTFGGILDLLAFDPRLDTASLVLHPQGQPVIQAGPRGALDVRPSSGVSTVFGGVILGLLGDVVGSRAATDAQQLLGAAFRSRLSSDITATINLGTGQVDFMAEQLPSGVAPMRPFTSPLADGDHFLVNEQQELQPGMPRVVGPFDPAVGALVDFLTDGHPIRYRAYCRATVEEAFGRSVPVGQPPALPPPSPTTSGVVPSRATASIAMPCHWYLLTEADTLTRVQVRVHGATFLGPPIP
jgi:hypothetical protein